MKHRIRVDCTMKSSQGATGFITEALKSDGKAIAAILGRDIAKICEATGTGVCVDYSFDDEKDAQDLMTELKKKQDNISSGTIKYELCGHDTRPPLPCVPVEEVKVGITPTEIR